MNIGIIDADLLDGGTKHPNLALMKISGYYKKFAKVTLLERYEDIPKYDKVFISKVFDFTETPDLSIYDNVELGGTGFFGMEAKSLPDEIEHHFPDYHLYDNYVQRKIAEGRRASYFGDYLNGSVGFLTRGCFRKCGFCVNRKYDKAFKHSDVTEFLDQSRRIIFLHDDNFLAYSGWKEELDKLKATGKTIQFKQGLDIRLMTERKAKELSTLKVYNDWIFAFDSIKDKELIESKLALWRKYCKRKTKLYILVAYESQDEQDIVNAFERIIVLMKYQCTPYIMRYTEYENSKIRGMYINLARWCNQPSMFKKKSFREFCMMGKENDSTMRYLKEFEKEYPEIAEKYFDIKYSDYNS